MNWRLRYLYSHTIVLASQASYQREVIALSRLQASPNGVGKRNIMELAGSYQHGDQFCVVSNLLTGKDLFEFTILGAKNGGVGEGLAAQVYRQMLDGVGYCHANGVIHRDVKPENFAFESSYVAGQPVPTLRLLDFGLAVCLPPGAHDSEPLTVGCIWGKSQYLAPECSADRSQFSPLQLRRIDAWALGVCLYMMLNGCFPQEDRGQGLVFANQNLSMAATDLMRGLLARNPAQRLSVFEAAAHPWVVQHIELSPVGSPGCSPSLLPDSTSDELLDSITSISIEASHDSLSSQNMLPPRRAGGRSRAASSESMLCEKRPRTLVHSRARSADSFSPESSPPQHTQDTHTRTRRARASSTNNFSPPLTRSRARSININPHSSSPIRFDSAMPRVSE